MKVLLVDDDPDIRMIAELALSRLGGWDVSVAESGSDALTQLARRIPDLIVLDMMMPGMDGLGTLAAIRRDERLAHVPVIFMTAKVQSPQLDRFLEAGAIGCVRKPFDPMLLVAELTGILSKAGHVI